MQYCWRLFGQCCSPPSSCRFRYEPIVDSTTSKATIQAGPVVHDLASVDDQTMTRVFQEQHKLGDPDIGSPTDLDTSVCGS